jgi:hypothetical protein
MRVFFSIKLPVVSGLKSRWILEIARLNAIPVVLHFAKDGITDCYEKEESNNQMVFIEAHHATVSPIFT